MRNWNFYPVLPFYIPARQVESLPMRNWNLYSSQILGAVLLGWIFTYEELKHPFMPDKTDWSACWIFTYEELKPMPKLNECWDLISWIFTYEELKPVFLSWTTSWISRWIFTYEELKPIVPDEGVSLSVVESLPMRNWNCFASFSGKSLVTLNLYLWGIETQ